jgi:uncharacterized membrane protein
MSDAEVRRSIGNRLAPPRFILFVLAMLGAGALAWVRWHDPLFAIMAGFDVAAALFLATCLPLLRVDDGGAMRADALANDANRAMLLAITGIVMAVILVAVAAEIAGGEAASLPTKLLVIATLLLAWLFSNSIYALHYAHLAYLHAPAEGCGGIDFPGTKQPVYADFVYFGFTLGMTFQTSDVAISDSRIRRAVTIHCLAAFVFNLGVLAFTINLLGK